MWSGFPRKTKALLKCRLKNKLLLAGKELKYNFD